MNQKLWKPGLFVAVGLFVGGVGAYAAGYPLVGSAFGVLSLAGIAAALLVGKNQASDEDLLTAAPGGAVEQPAAVFGPMSQGAVEQSAETVEPVVLDKEQAKAAKQREAQERKFQKQAEKEAKKAAKEQAKAAKKAAKNAPLFPGATAAATELADEVPDWQNTAGEQMGDPDASAFFAPAGDVTGESVEVVDVVEAPDATNAVIDDWMANLTNDPRFNDIFNQAAPPMTDLTDSVEESTPMSDPTTEETFMSDVPTDGFAADESTPGFAADDLTGHHTDGSPHLNDLDFFGDNPTFRKFTAEESTDGADFADGVEMVDEAVEAVEVVAVDGVEAGAGEPVAEFGVVAEEVAFPGLDTEQPAASFETAEQVEQVESVFAPVDMPSGDSFDLPAPDSAPVFAAPAEDVAVEDVTVEEPVAEVAVDEVTFAAEQPAAEDVAVETVVEEAVVGQGVEMVADDTDGAYPVFVSDQRTASIASQIAEILTNAETEALRAADEKIAAIQAEADRRVAELQAAADEKDQQVQTLNTQMDALREQAEAERDRLRAEYDAAMAQMVNADEAEALRTQNERTAAMLREAESNLQKVVDAQKTISEAATLSSRMQMQRSLNTLREQIVMTGGDQSLLDLIDQQIADL